MSREKPHPFPIRHHQQQGWQVLIVPEDTWLACANETDARVIASAPVLEFESHYGLKSGGEFAKELESVSAALSRYQIGFGSRFFRMAAERACEST